MLAAERAGKPFLAFRDGAGVLRIFLMGRGAQTRTVGRRAEMDLSIQWDPEISGLHAELQGLGGEWTIIDDGLSRNGTYVNGHRIHSRQRLRDGDRVRVGRTILAFNAACSPASANDTETAAASENHTATQLTDTERRILIALCRPCHDAGTFAAPASNQQIAGEVFLSVDAVKAHLRHLFAKFELGELPQNQKRARLAECVLQYGVVSPREFG